MHWMKVWMKRMLCNVEACCELEQMLWLWCCSLESKVSVFGREEKWLLEGLLAVVDYRHLIKHQYSNTTHPTPNWLRWKIMSYKYSNNFLVQSNFLRLKSLVSQFALHSSWIGQLSLRFLWTNDLNKSAASWIQTWKWIIEKGQCTIVPLCNRYKDHHDNYDDHYENVEHNDDSRLNAPLLKRDHCDTSRLVKS